MFARRIARIASSSPSFYKSLSRNIALGFSSSLTTTAQNRYPRGSSSTFVWSCRTMSSLSSSFSSPLDYSRLNFSWSPEEIEKGTQDIISTHRALFDDIAALPESALTFSNTFEKIALLDGKQNPVQSSLTFPGYVHPTKETRDASTEASKKLSAYAVEAAMRVDVFEKLSKVTAPEDPVDRRFYDKTLLSFKRNGLHLPQETRDRVAELKKELSEISIAFSRNIAEDKTSIEATREQLAGMSEDFIGQLTKMEEGGKEVFVLTTDYPVMFPLLRHCKVEETRRRMEHAYADRCREQNVPLMQRGIKIRAELANLLGYKDYASYVLEVRMAKTPGTVLSFLNNLRDQLTPLGLEERKELLQLLSEEQSGSVRSELDAWNYLYSMERLKEQKFQISEEVVSEYFPMEKVLEGVLDIYQRVLNVKFYQRQCPAALKWVQTEDVQYYEVFDAKTNDFCGAFYLDLFPRPGKYTHAAVFPLQATFSVGRDQRQYPVVALVCNFTKPTETKPSLLKHSEVVTLLHELGHAFHGVLSTSKYEMFAGTRVERDFVECPSQALENWGWHPDGLRAIARHYRTGEQMPQDLMQRLIRTRNVCDGLVELRQLFFGLFDMHVHTRTPEDADAVDVVELWSKMRTDVTLVKHSDGTAPAAGFNHIMSGYEASYYGYMYSLVFASDLFSRFLECGDVFSPAVGSDLRHKLLARGGTVDGGDLIRDFLGREPNNQAFLRTIGLIKE